MEVKSLLFLTVYKIIHFLYWYFVLILNIVEYVHLKYLYLHRVLTNTKDQDFICEHVKKLTKLPTHITFLLSTEEPCYDNLAKLVIWCITAGIPFISFYDYKGEVKKNEDKLQKAVEKLQKTETNGAPIVWYSGENTYENGSFGKKTNIRTFSLSDGQRKIAETARELCSRKAQVIDQQMVESVLKKSYVFPDPDLALYCGKSFVLYGYPPWQIRVTEFLSLGSHHDLSLDVFINRLYKFSKIEQRLGR